MTTMKQPFQCNLQPEIQEPHRTRHTGTTTRCKTHRRNRLNSKRSKPHPPRRRGTFHRRLQPIYTEKHKVSCSGFLPKRKPMQHSCSHYNAFFQCDLPPQLQEPHRTTHTDTTTRCKTHRRNNSRTKRPQPHPSHRRGTFHRRLQPLYTEKHKVSCSGFLPTTKPMQHSCSHSNAICHSSPLPIVTTSLPHHFPSSPLPFLTTSHRHHFPSSSLPIVSNSIASHFPSSSLPIATTSLPHHFPSSPLPFLTTPLHHHFPSSPLPFLTTSLPHHFPSSPLPAITTSLPHHSPSSPLPFVATSVTRKYCFPTSFD